MWRWRNRCGRVLNCRDSPRWTGWRLRYACGWRGRSARVPQAGWAKRPGNKFLDLVASSVIFSTTVDMTTALRDLTAEGWTLRGEDLSVLSPHRRTNVLRFGDYDTHRLQPRPRQQETSVRTVLVACRSVSLSYRQEPVPHEPPWGRWRVRILEDWGL
ncbi:Tn3 family transposase [Streptomyces sp. NPDC058579]|uniref:Tn3 family transposase n=1 Tax=Streptomyces sp. NPDC058579 TaxID=3346548 RepID=UPI0036482091